MTETVDKLGAHEVAAWLRRHPGFLKQFPDLALTLVMMGAPDAAAGSCWVGSDWPWLR